MTSAVPNHTCHKELNSNLNVWSVIGWHNLKLIFRIPQYSSIQFLIAPHNEHRKRSFYKADQTCKFEYCEASAEKGAFETFLNRSLEKWIFDFHWRRWLLIRLESRPSTPLEAVFRFKGLESVFLREGKSWLVAFEAIICGFLCHCEA